MKEQREEQLLALLEKHRDELQKSGKLDELRYLIGVRKDSASKETSSISLANLKRDSSIVTELENLGFKVIYPAKLTKERVNKMSIAEKFEYDRKINCHALVIDGNEKCRSLDFANDIAEHYFSTSSDRTPYMGSIDITNNSTTRYIPKEQYKDETFENFKKLLTDVGFKYTMEEAQIPNNEKITISSDVPYPAVKKSKFGQIYDKAKNKIQGILAKLKSVVKPKDQIKENDQNER